LPHRLCLSRVLLAACLFSFLQYTTLPTYCKCSLFLLLFRVHMGGCLSPTLQWSLPHFSCYYKSSPLQAHWGRWHHTHLLQPACLFHVKECPSPTLR
jgi:hypothetical protein